LQKVRAKANNGIHPAADLKLCGKRTHAVVEKTKNLVRSNHE
jgi:hypothetical protein